MEHTARVISALREEVMLSYNLAKASNYRQFLQGVETATSEYIFDNQIIDANEVVSEYYRNNRRVVSITKKTKVGMNGLMIEVAKLMTTHPDDKFVIDPKNIRIITGMSNISWEKEMKDSTPTIFKDNIFHHGKLQNTNLKELKNALIIIDEIDTADGELQRLHTVLKEAGVLSVKFMEENNIRFMFASATAIKELYDLYRWGELHKIYTMTIPQNYIGHVDFLNKGIIKEYYPLNTQKNAEKWIDEDILLNYGADYRIHIVRVKSSTILLNACIRKDISFHNHTSTDRLSTEKLSKLFSHPLTAHIVIAIKGFYRRANLIPNKWKLRIGATHEEWTKKVDNNVQIQGLPGRMTGYWRDTIENGHKTGPYRTSVKAVQEYEKITSDPFGLNSYHCAGFIKNNGTVSAISTMLSPRNIKDLVVKDLPAVEESSGRRISDVFDDITLLDAHMRTIFPTGKFSHYSLSSEHTIKYRDITRKVLEYSTHDVFIKEDIYAGIASIKSRTDLSTVCRIMPVLVKEIVKWVGIYIVPV